MPRPRVSKTKAKPRSNPKNPMPNFIKLTLLNGANKTIKPAFHLRVDVIVAVQEASEMERGHHPEANAIVHTNHGAGYLVRENAATIFSKLEAAELGQGDETEETAE